MRHMLRVLAGATVALLAASCSDGGATEVVGVAAPAQEHGNTTEAFGLVVGERSKNIHLDLPATVVAVHVTEAQLVERGDVLVTLDLTEYETLLATRENRLATERLKLRRMEQTLVRDHQRSATELQRQEIALITAHAEAQQAREEYDAEQRVGEHPLRRMEQLRLTAESSERRVDELELAIKEAQSTYDEQTTALLVIASAPVDGEDQSTPQALDIAVQRRAVAIVELEVAALKRSGSRPYLDRTRVISEFDRAIVTDLAVRPGDRVDRNHLLRLIDLDSVIVEAHVAEEFIRDVQVGDPVTIIPLADPSRESRGSVQRLSGMAVFRSGETIVPVAISIDDNQGLLLPNFNVDVIIHQQ